MGTVDTGAVDWVGTTGLLTDTAGGVGGMFEGPLVLVFAVAGS